MRRRLRLRLKRFADRPFATALSGVLLSGGIIALTHSGLTADAIEGLVPGWLVTTLSVSYALSGLFLLIGLGFERPDIEAAGCVLALSGISVRVVALLTVVGFIVPVLATLVFYVLLMWAFLERLRQILRHQSIVRVTTKLQIEDEDGEVHVG